MKLRTNGPVISAYRWLYGISSYNLGYNFCPIFWMIVLGAVLIVPYAVFCLPVVLYELADKNYRNGDRSFAERLGISVLFYAFSAALYFVFRMFLFFFGYLGANDKGVIPGILFSIAVITVTIIHYTVQYFERRRNKRLDLAYRAAFNGEVLPDTLGDIIANTWSSFYDKHCPRITWIFPSSPPDPPTKEDKFTYIPDAELTLHNDPILGTTYTLKNIKTESPLLKFPNLKD